MNAFTRVMLAAIGGLSIATAVSSPALAACGNPGLVTVPGAIKTASSTPVADGPDIVGLWQFTFSSVGNSGAGIPDGAPLDMGYAQWHSDGTEIMNSGRDPATGNFCLGTYTSDGHRTYKLNHFALAWDNTGMFCKPAAGAPSCFVGPTNIREEVTVDAHGDTYTGHVSITQYDNANHVMFTLTGTVVGHRINADAQ
jgi:hypothetical protein